MGLMNAFNAWKNSRYENHLNQMKEANKCPDCNGKGYVIHPSMDYTYANSYECPGCSGTGLYSEWENAMS